LAPAKPRHQPRVSPADVKLLNGLYVIKIDDETYSNVPQEIVDEYNLNMEEQTSNHCIRTLPNVVAFLKKSLDQSLDDLPRHVWTHGYDPNLNDEETTMIKLVRFILTDYVSNCEKRPMLVPNNERTPFVEHVVPIFKYFASTTKLLSFLWCEKGLESSKILAICMPNGVTKKLMDGIGIAPIDGMEEVLVESSGYGSH
ncbi:uncharacterized protein EV154DRAFT_414110, partial [Mucor mucedo]|uniref:uncharacterized protein n=1 Tax=Mucor mucedo TaxID=29922 RepID=UPI00221FD966